MIKKIEYNYFHWGPFLYKTKLNNKEINNIKKLCKKNSKKNCRKNLAGLIKNEYRIDKNKLFPIIFPYIDSYHRASYEHYNIRLDRQITLENSWVNYMTKFESNPIHTHDHDLSFVIFTHISKQLKQEFNNTITSGHKPGFINFLISLNNDKQFISERSFEPEVGDFFIFPASLNHYVNHFEAGGERISVSGNVSFNKDKK